MPSNHDAMKRALRDKVIPILRRRGFAGSFPHFRRISATKTDLLTFQFQRGGGGFLIELAEGPADQFTTPSGERIPARNLTAWDLSPLQRSRLLPGKLGAVAVWYGFDRDVLPTAVADQVIEDLPLADAWFAGAKTQPRIHGYPFG